MTIKAIYALSAEAYDLIYGPAEREEIARLVEIIEPLQTAASVQEDATVLADADVILSGWGCPVLTQEVLAAAPRVKAVFYGAGTVKYFVTEAFWDRGIRLSSAWHANAVPVSEYTLSQILWGLKCGWQHVAACREARAFRRLPAAGARGSTVGLVSLGAVGRLVVQRLKPFDVQVIAYDPYVTAEEGAALGVEMVSLEDVFRRGDVVSLHTPWLPETVGLITGTHLESMKPYSTFVNSARGAVVREGELADVLRSRPDLVAVLDVTYPEPPPPESPLWDLPNVILTPHIAGSVGVECHRQGQYMVEELSRYLAGEPLRYEVTRAQVGIMA